MKSALDWSEELLLSVCLFIFLYIIWVEKREMCFAPFFSAFGEVVLWNIGQETTVADVLLLWQIIFHTFDIGI